jgi:hypothetical protein
MNRITSIPGGAKLNVGGLLLAAIGMFVEIGAGSILYPTLTGPIVLTVGATLVALQLGRWTAYVGLLIPLVLAVGLVISAAMSPAFADQLTGFDDAAMVLGSLSHVIGLAAAVTGGVWRVLRRGAEQAALPEATR